MQALRRAHGGRIAYALQHAVARRASTFGAVSGCMLVLPLVPECQAPGFIDEPV